MASRRRSPPAASAPRIPTRPAFRRSCRSIRLGRAPRRRNRGVQPTITIDPSAMPAGAELSFGYFQLSSGQQQADLVLTDSSSYTCTSGPPDPNGPPDGYGQSDSFGLLYGGPGPAGS